MTAYHYYVNDNDQPTGEHEVHASWCRYVEEMASKTYLGIFSSSDEAVQKAKTIYYNSDGCANCCPLSHTR